MKMSDAEIIKALECCSKNPPSCAECNYKGKCNRRDCYDYLKLDALDLINRQKAESEELEHSLLHETELLYDANEELKTAKSEAVKEFVEAYKDQIKNYTGMFTDEGFYVSLEAVLSAVDFIFEKLKGNAVR